MARILIIDDDLMVSRLLQEHLSNEGYQVEAASMSKDGLAMAFKSPPDLIFLDVMLPDATGFQTLGKLRANAQTKPVPVILMTGAARSPNQQKLGRNMGAQDYILKPFNVIQVGERVRELLGAKPQDQATVQPVPEASVAPPEPEPAPPVEPAPAPAPEPTPQVDPVIPLQASAPAWPTPATETETEPIVPQQPVTPTSFMTEPPPEPEPPLPERPATSPWQAPAPTPEPAPQPNLSEMPWPPRVDVRASQEKEMEIPLLPLQQKTSETPPPDTERPRRTVEKEQEEPTPVVQPPPIQRRAAPERTRPAPVTRPPSPAPVKAAPASVSAVRPAGCLFAAMIFVAHLTFAAAGAAAFESEALIARAVASVAVGWVLLWGLLVGLAALMRITIDVRAIVRIAGWTAGPIVMKTLGGFLSLWMHFLEPLRSTGPSQLPFLVLCLRPLDIFEMTAALILGLSLRRQPGGSIAKSIVATLAVALIWSFAANGYLNLLLNTSKERPLQTPVSLTTPPPAVPVPLVPTSPASVSPPPEPAPVQKKIQTFEEERKEIREERRLQELRLQSTDTR